MLQNKALCSRDVKKQTNKKPPLGQVGQPENLVLTYLQKVILSFVFSDGHTLEDNLPTKVLCPIKIFPRPNRGFFFDYCRTHESTCLHTWNRYIFTLTVIDSRKMLFSLLLLSSVLVNVAVKDLLHEPVIKMTEKNTEQLHREKKNAKTQKKLPNSWTAENNPTVLVEGTMCQHSWELNYRTPAQRDFTMHCKPRNMACEVLSRRHLWMQLYSVLLALL